jgi:hypothetical protein
MGRASRLLEYRMAPDYPPHNVRLAADYFVAVLERRPAVIGPGHLEDSRRTLDAFHTEALPEGSALSEIVDELSDRGQEQRPLSWSEAFEILRETTEPSVGGQGRIRTAAERGA